MIGENVRAIRLARDLSQAELGKSAGISQQAVYMIEKGVNSPSYSVLIKMARTLGVSVADLVGDDDAATEPPHAESVTRGG